MKKVVLLIFIVFIFGCLLSGIAFASGKDVAYVYRKAFRVDDNVISVFNELGFDVKLIKESDLRKTDFSDYKLIFVGDERFLDVSKIPATKYPSIISNYYHGYEFGLTDPDGISQLASTAPLNVKIGSRIVQVYTQAFYKPWERIAIPYYYLSDLNKAPGFRKVAATYTGDSYDLGSVIAYADAGSQLNGKFAQGKICFFGIIESDFWTPAAKQMFKDCVNFVSITCSTDEDCDDNNPNNIDKCMNPGTVESYCKHYEIACFKDEDCGQSDFIGEPHCVGNDLYQDYKEFKCNKPGTSEASCSYEIQEKLKQKCSRGCENDKCVEAHDIGIKVYGDYISGIKITNAETEEIITADPAMLKNGEKYKLQFKIVNSGSFDEEVQYIVSILRGSSTVYEFSPGTTTLGAGKTSTDRTRTWDVELPEGEYDIKASINIIGFEDDNPEDNVKYRHVVIGQPVGECQDVLEIKPGINFVSLKCKYEANDIQSLFAGKMDGGPGAVEADVIWKLVPGEYDEYGPSYKAAFQVDWQGAGELQGKWFDEGKGDLSTFTFEPGEGFLIENRHDEKTITLSGKEPPDGIIYSFVKGLNMFGLAEEISASSFLELVPNCYVLKAWNPDEEYRKKYLESYASPISTYFTIYPASEKYSDVYDEKYDINSNGVVDIYDVFSISSCYSGRCDLNSDNTLDIDDFLIVLEKAGSTNKADLYKYDIDSDEDIDDYDALAIFSCIIGACDLNSDGKTDTQDRDIVAEHEQYNIENFRIEVNKGYQIECSKSVCLGL